MEHVDIEICKFFEPCEYLTVAKGKTFEDAAAELAVALRYMLTGLFTILLDSFYHAGWVGKDSIVWIDDTQEGWLLHCFSNQFAMSQTSLVTVISSCRIFPFLTATLVDPHTTDILEESGSTLDTAFVCEVEFIAMFIDDSLLSLYTHEAPSARTEVSELFILGRNGSYCAGSIMSCYSDDRYCIQARYLLYFLGECADDGSWCCHFSKLFALQSETLNKILVEVACHRIENLRGGGYSIFADSVTGKHIAQRIRNKEYFVCILQSHIASLAHSVYLEEGVEVHELDARLFIYLFLADLLVEVFLHHAHCMWVSIGERVAENGSVLAHIYKVASPGVDSDALDVDASLSHEFQALDDFQIERIDVPIEVIARLDEMVVETCQFFQIELSI